MTVSGLSATPAAVSLREVLFRWPGAASVCLDVPAFDIGATEHVFLCGPSGSGKSTLLSLVGGVLSPQRGRIEVAGHCLSAMPAARRDRFRAAHIGFIFQLFNLIPYLSGMDNVLLPCRFSAVRARRLPDDGRAEALRLAARLELDAALLDKPAGALSVGQQQRVAAARALIGRPSLVIADEPTSALDADRRRLFLDLLLAECRAAGAALLFVSHDAQLSARFDRVVALDTLNRAQAGGG